MLNMKVKQIAVGGLVFTVCCMILGGKVLTLLMCTLILQQCHEHLPILYPFLLCLCYSEESLMCNLILLTVAIIRYVHELCVDFI
jgi:hypothetical protein